MNPTPLHEITEKLNYFLLHRKIPNIIFHGASGSGKRTILNNFLSKIYGGDNIKMKHHVMVVNCSHGKGIKFIREELKFFAKTQIQSDDQGLFKSLVLLNADSLTIDAQSALRRCIELFSHNTRFFIIVENKHRLLNPILSRFCEIHVPETMDENGNIINMHQLKLQNHYDIDANKKARDMGLIEFLKQFKCLISNDTSIIDLANTLYERGNSVIDLIHILPSIVNEVEDQNLIAFCYYKLKPEFRCEKMLFFYILKYIYCEPFVRNQMLKNMLFM